MLQVERLVGSRKTTPSSGFCIFRNMSTQKKSTTDYYNTLQEKYAFAISSLGNASAQAESVLLRLVESKAIDFEIKREMKGIFDNLQSAWSVLDILNKIEMDMKKWANALEDFNSHNLDDDDTTNERENEVNNCYLDIKDLIDKLWDWWGRNLDWGFGYYPSVRDFGFDLIDLDEILSKQIEFPNMTLEEAEKLVEGPKELVEEDETE